MRRTAAAPYCLPRLPQTPLPFRISEQSVRISKIRFGTWGAAFRTAVFPSLFELHLAFRTKSRYNE